MRRYVDLLNQWQIIAAIRHGATAALVAPFKPKDAALFGIISAFDASYSGYGSYQASMERFWTLRYLQDHGITELEGSVIREGLVRANTLPLVVSVLGADNLPRQAQVRIRLGTINLMALDVTGTVTALLDDAVADTTDAEAEEGEEDALAAGPLVLAVDTDEVYMTTKLAGKATFFLPFNKGHRHGKGNPPNPHGHKSAYLWQEVFSKESLANIIQHFVRLDGSAKELLNKRTLFFPRYHQLDVVRKLVDHAAHHGVGQTYLIQHSAGSGKSNSIAWLAHQLIGLEPGGHPMIDSVLVVTDRRILDKQIRDNIKH